GSVGTAAPTLLAGAPVQGVAAGGALGPSAAGGTGTPTANGAGGNNSTSPPHNPPGRGGNGGGLNGFGAPGAQLGSPISGSVTNLAKVAAVPASQAALSSETTDAAPPA